MSNERLSDEALADLLAKAKAYAVWSLIQALQLAAVAAVVREGQAARADVSRHAASEECRESVDVALDSGGPS